MISISIVSPCFNEIDNIPLFINQIETLRKNLIDAFTIDLIVVDDHSNDGSAELLQQYEQSLPWLKVVRNSRNYGVYRTSYIGLKFAKGQWIVPMLPVDMQDPIEVLEEMIHVKNQNNITAVFGKKVDRQEGALLKNLRLAYYRILNKISANKINQNVGEFGVIDSWVIDECIKRDDYYPYIRGMISNITQDILFHEYVWKSRVHGESKHNYVKLYDQALNGFISSGAQFFRPLTFIGFLISIFSIGFSFLNIFLYFFDRSIFEVSGIASLIVLLSLGFGFLFIFLGFLGEYVVAIHSQVRGMDRFNP